MQAKRRIQVCHVIADERYLHVEGGAEGAVHAARLGLALCRASGEEDGEDYLRQRGLPNVGADDNL